MATGQYLLSNWRAGLRSVISTRDATDFFTYLISDVGITSPIASPSSLPGQGAAQMDGWADVSFSSRVVLSAAAQMDGQAQMLAVSIPVTMGAAHMNGHASMIAVAPHVDRSHMKVLRNVIVRQRLVFGPG